MIAKPVTRPAPELIAGEGIQLDKTNPKVVVIKSAGSNTNGAPTFVDPDEVFTVGRKSQLLFSSPIDCEGILAVDGLLIEVI